MPNLFCSNTKFAMGVYYSLNKDDDSIHNKILKGKTISNIHNNKRKLSGLRKHSLKSNFRTIKVISNSPNSKDISDLMYTSSESKPQPCSQIIHDSSINSREYISPTLPRRKSPIPMHAKIFNSCVPLSGLRRSLSLPKQNSLLPKQSSPEFRMGISGFKCLSRHDSKRSATAGDASPVGTEISFSSGSWSKEQLCKSKSGKCGHSVRDKQYDNEFELGQDNPIFGHCLNCLDDQETNTTILCSEYMPSVEDSSSVFCDPILAKLEAELPVPPPPPRAYPPWLKSALAKQAASNEEPMQKLNIPSRCCVGSSLQLPTSQLSPVTSNLGKQKALSLENSRFNVRIYPIIQNGVKISDTHYWLLDPPRSRAPHDPTTLTRRATEHVRVPPSSPFDNSPTADGYTNIEYTEFCPPGELPLKDVKLRRGKSENCKDSLKNFHQELVFRLMKQVPLATESECQAVLIGSSYNYEEAIRRLKFELLCRKGYVSRSHSKRLLNKYNWDLDAAIHRARCEYEYRKLKRQEKESMLLNHEEIKSTNNCDTFSIPCSSASSDSSLSPLPCSIHQQSVISPWYDETRKSNLF